MGPCISIPHRKLSLMREGSTKRFYRSRNGNLSATFHVLDSDLRWDLLNINHATEEQLMTLPGINRITAENIVEYRQRIGGFKKVEDLALVSGVGASKLEQFRTEICVGRRKGLNGSYNSSLTQSLESLQTENGPRSSPSKLVNVNTANVFQLMSVCRMTQEMAANIVHYRERKGPLKNLDELSKVKGLPPDRLAVVKMYLTVDSSSSNNTSVNSKHSHSSVYGRRPIGHRRTNSAPSGFEKSRSCDRSTKDFYELVSSLVIREPLNDSFDYSYSGRNVLRIASWNLQNFFLDKAKNPGVQEVICRTYFRKWGIHSCSSVIGVHNAQSLANRSPSISLIAVQEVGSKEALSLIASELNEPKLYSVKNWKGDKGRWHTLVPPTSGDNSFKKATVNGFLYDTSHGLQLEDSFILKLPSENLDSVTVSCQPFVTSFKIEKTNFIVINVNLISESYVAKLFPPFLQSLKDDVQLRGKKNVFLAGDFILPPGHTIFEVLNSQGYSHLLPVDAANDVKWNEESHIWSSCHIRKLFTGHSGVICEGLNHLAIPDGWKWGGRVSEHCPVWAEIYISDNLRIPATTPLSNGISKIPVDLISDSVTENLINEKTKEKNKGFWERNWIWRYNKQHVTCEKATGKENGSL